MRAIYDYIIYTDGGCERNPGGRGGYGAVIINNSTGELTDISGVDKFAYCSATFLVNLTHNQDPWINAYVNGQRNEITKEDIKRYFDD